MYWCLRSFVIPASIHTYTCKIFLARMQREVRVRCKTPEDFQNNLQHRSGCSANVWLCVDVQPDAQATFVRIKQAYLTLSDTGSRTKYDKVKSATNSGSWGQDFDPFSWGSKGKPEKEEEFYGIGTKHIIPMWLTWIRNMVSSHVYTCINVCTYIHKNI